jgi:hypothetical protein
MGSGATGHIYGPTGGETGDAVTTSNGDTATISYASHGSSRNNGHSAAHSGASSFSSFNGNGSTD